MKITETDKFIKFISTDPDCFVYNGFLWGEEIVVPHTANLPKESFILLPKNLIPDDEYFASNSEYAEGGMWDNIQERGELKDCSYIFANWSDCKRIIPKYPFSNVDMCMYALKDCKGLVDARNLVFHIKNTDPKMLYVCANCSNMVYAPRFVFYNAKVVRDYMSMYAGCMYLTHASIYWGDGSQDPIAERSACQNTFFKCYNLKNLEFLGKGSPVYLDLSYCKDLSFESLVSLGNSLMPIDTELAEEQGSKHEITLNPHTHKLLKGEVSAMLENPESVTFLNEKVSGVPNNSTATTIIPYFKGMEDIKTIAFDITFNSVSGTNPNGIYAEIYVGNSEAPSFVTTPNLSFMPNVTLSLIPDGSNTPVLSKSDLEKGISINIINGNTELYTVEIANLKVYYPSRADIFTNKGWTIKELERTEDIIM